MNLGRVLKELAQLTAKAAEGKHYRTHRESGQFDPLKAVVREVAAQDGPAFHTRSKRDGTIAPETFVSKCAIFEGKTAQYTCDPKRTPAAVTEIIHHPAPQLAGTYGCVPQDEEASAPYLYAEYPREIFEKKEAYDKYIADGGVELRTIDSGTEEKPSFKKLCDDLIAAPPSPTPTQYGYISPSIGGTQSPYIPAGIGLAVGFTVLPVVLLIGGGAYCAYKGYQYFKNVRRVGPSALEAGDHTDAPKRVRKPKVKGASPVTVQPAPTRPKPYSLSKAAQGPQL